MATAFGLGWNLIPAHARVTEILRIEDGSTSALASYISPLRYEGTAYALSAEWLIPSDENGFMNIETSGTFQNMYNPSQTAKTLGLNGELIWGYSNSKKLPANFQISYGASADIYAGVLYLPRNSNNPAAVNASFGGALDGALSWRTHFKGFPILIREKIHIPIAGLAFAPAYGETFYEIWLGNTAGIAQFVWPGNSFRFDNRFSAMIDLGPVAYEIGVHNNLYTSWMRGLNTQVSTFALSLGIIPRGLGLKRQPKASKTGNQSIFQ